jgi:glycine/D-amino acid oxidase-like deaminating enzyme
MYDAIIIGGGHNGLITAAYLAKSEKKSVYWKVAEFRWLFINRGALSGLPFFPVQWPLRSLDLSTPMNTETMKLFGDSFPQLIGNHEK